MKLLHLLNEVLRKLEEWIIAYSIILMAIILIANVLARNLLNTSLNFAEEVSQFLTIFVTFFGTSYAARRARHIRMSLLYDIFGEKGQKILVLIGSMGTAVLMFYLSYLSYRYVARVAALNRVSPILQFPLYIVWSAIPIGCFLTGIQYLLTFIKNITVKETWLSFESRFEYDEDLPEAGGQGDSRGSKQGLEGSDA
ncbi:MAG: C4-dicarboxylate transporter, DctQ subunit [Synergistales bacterium]|jgi:TRAP-type C4-dicarboxylate transport system permease small subunit|nr:C4-dicarboxylate transporter, DctQ subunit [Synergistales bacterium]